MKKEKEMSFIDHLEELRWHIIRSLGAVLIFSIIAFLSKQIVFGIILLGPSGFEINNIIIKNFLILNAVKQIFSRDV